MREVLAVPHPNRSKPVQANNAKIADNCDEHLRQHGKDGN